jgi:hypothetical protein
MFEQRKIDKVVGKILWVVAVLYVLTIPSQRYAHRAVNVSLAILLGILLVYSAGKWALGRLGAFQSGSIMITRGALVNALGAIAALIILCAVVEYLFHGFSVTQLAIKDLQESEEGRNALGAPIRPGWIVTGNVHIEGNGGAASLSIPVSGDRAGAVLKASGNKENGAWHVVDLYLIVNGSKAVVPIPH